MNGCFPKSRAFDYLVPCWWLPGKDQSVLWDGHSLPTLPSAWPVLAVGGEGRELLAPVSAAAVLSCDRMDSMSLEPPVPYTCFYRLLDGYFMTAGNNTAVSPMNEHPVPTELTSPKHPAHVVL